MQINRCRLSGHGVDARNDLLELLYPGKSYTNSGLERDTKLNRGKTIPKILGEDKDSGIQLGKITQFFEKLLGKIIQHNKDINNKHQY